MGVLPQELTDRISDFSIGDNSYWKNVFSNCLNEINTFGDESLVDNYLCRLNVSVDEFILDFGKFIDFCKQYQFYNILIERVFVFCCVEDHPFIDVIHHELLGMGMVYISPGDYYVNMFNKSLVEIKSRGIIY